VPQAFVAFLEFSDFESAIHLTVSLGGDCDTLTCITGSIAESFYGGVPEHIALQALSFLDNHLFAVTKEFTERYAYLDAIDFNF
jgi:ADP-ribosylglycohydrolase